MPKKSSLMDFQTQFVKAMFAPEQNRSFTDSITPAGQLTNGASALRIHQRGYVCRLTEALGETYEAVWSVVGDESFFELSEGYIKSHRSSSYNLNDYGRHFAEFIEGTSHMVDFPFLADLARFELAFFDAFHSPEHQPLKPSDLVQIGTHPYSILTFGPSVTFLHFSSSVYEIWKLRKQRERKVPQFLGPQFLAVYKKNGLIFVDQISEREFNMLFALRSGVSPGDYLDDASYPHDLKAADVSAIFYFLTSAGLICAIDRRSGQAT